MKNLYGFKVIVPADANQMDRVIRYILPRKGNWLVVMGRSSQPLILKEDGTPFFGGNYTFEYGKADLLREGKDASLLCMGQTAWRAVKIWEELKKKGISIQVWHISCPLSLDESALEQAVETGLIITYEDHHVNTGLGSSVGEKLLDLGRKVKFIRKGVTRFAGSSVPEDLYRYFGLDIESMVKLIEKELKKS
ncbi:MAG TPA: hypothetical protein ENG13_00655 [bacterium]|nr:hypothetical protein [bacterium]HEX67560.1 hypothetical protein [bacterium]